MRPPSLRSLTIDNAVLHIYHIHDLSSIPDPLLLQLFLKTIEAGKLNEKVLSVFMNAGSEPIIALIDSLQIPRNLFNPILPTRCKERQL
ncbi:hypothetical protein AMTRI_Chr06g173690 [Amborella trichopoda]